MDLFQKTLEPVKRVLQDSNLEKSDVDEIILVGGSTRIPKIRELLQKFFNGKKLNDKINPDEAVAYGAAVQAAVLARTIEDKDIVLIDVTPLSLGIETAGGVMATIIPRNTPIPTQKFDIFTTSSDYQERLSIPIYEGERRMTKFNRLLGELQLTGIPPAPKGVPKIKITFELDQNGILRVIAEDQATHNKREIEIQKGTLSADEIEKMTADAEKNAKKDAEFMEKEELKRKITAYIENVKAQLANKEISKKLTDNDKNTVADKVKKTLNWLNSKGNSLEKKDLQKGFQSMRNVINPIISKLYGSDGLSDDLLFGDNDNFDGDSSIDDNNPTPSVGDEPIDDNKGHDEL
jgi:molecular chaperone DnaK (HSP70)